MTKEQTDKESGVTAYLGLNDKIYDLKIKLNSINNQKINTTINTIQEKVPETASEEKYPFIKFLENNKKTILIITAVIIFTLLILYLILRRRRKKKNQQKQRVKKG